MMRSQILLMELKKWIILMKSMDSLVKKEPGTSMRFSKPTVALFAGGELDEEAKDAFYQAVTKAYLSCKMEAKKTFGRKKKNTETESDS